MAADIKGLDFTNLEGTAVEIFDLLISYLSQHSDCSAATAETVTDWALPFMDSIEDVPNIAFFWGALFWIIKQLPPDDSRQYSLIKLLLKIREQPSPPGQGRVTYEELYVSSQFWKDLPQWRAIWAAYELQAPLIPPMRDRRSSNSSGRAVLPESWCPPLSGSEWTSVNAFLARLHTASPGLRYSDLKGMWTILEALEREHTPSTLDDLVPSAACWILYAGRELKNNSEDYPQYDFDDESKRLPWSVGELYDGPKGFSDERWMFWKGRFNGMRRREDLREETRSYAERAWLEMAFIEVLDRVTPQENVTTSFSEPSEAHEAST